jgi:hypothetical protein
MDGEGHIHSDQPLREGMKHNESDFALLPLFRRCGAPSRVCISLTRKQAQFFAANAVITQGSDRNTAPNTAPAPAPSEPAALVDHSACPVAGRSTRHSLLFLSLPPAARRPVADADDLRRLPRRDFLRHGPENHFLYLHRPLHGGPRIRLHASYGRSPSPSAMLTDYLLTQPDISCANDIHRFA